MAAIDLLTSIPQGVSFQDISGKLGTLIGSMEQNFLNTLNSLGSNVTAPTESQMLAMQMQLTSYTLTMELTSAIVKGFSDSCKSVVQKVG